MLAFLCSLWPLLFAALLGWMACGALAYRLRGRDLSGAVAARDAQVQRLASELDDWKRRPPATVDKLVEVPVERIVDKRVPDTEGLAIDLAAARAAGFASMKSADDLEIIEGIGPKIAELLRGEGVRSFAQLARMTPAQIQPMLDRAGANYRVANPGTWPEQALLAAHNQWQALQSLQGVLVAGVRVDARGEQQRLKDELGKLKRELDASQRAPAIDLAAARAAGFDGIRGEDDREIVEGIGPQVNELLRAAGIRRFAELARCEVSRLREILGGGGPDLRLLDPETWPEQADLAARNRWRALKSLQSALGAGRREAQGGPS